VTQKLWSDIAEGGSPRAIFIRTILGAFACSRPKRWERFRKQTLGRGEELLLGSGWTLIRSELSSPNFNSSVRAERSFAIHYLNIVIKPLCGNLDICLTTRLTPTFSRGNLFACFSRWPRPKVKDAFLDRAFRSRSCTILQISQPKRISVKTRASECTY